MTALPTGPLAGLRVLDLAGEPAAFATRVLAELGADVVHVEPPGGDRLRRRQPFLGGEEGIERSLHHLHFNAGKRSVVLDLEAEGGRDALRELARSYDVLVETATPGVMEGRGLGYEELRAINPELVYVTVTPFGQDGPLRAVPGNDLTAVATSGLLYLNGFPDDPPVRPGAEQGFHMGSLVAVATLLVALVGRERDPARGGHRVDVSLQAAASMATLQTANANLYTWHGAIPRRQGIVSQSGTRAIFQCADGRWVSFVVPLGAPALWDAFVEWVTEEGVGEVFAEPGWSEAAYRAAHAAEAADAIDRLCAKHDRAHMFHEGQRRRMLVMPLSTAADLVESEQLAERGFFNRVRHEALGRDLVDVGPPYHFSRTPTRTDLRAPLLGEHTQAVISQLRGTGSQRDTPVRSAARPAGDPWRPLEGIRVADFCWLIAGPSATRVLADHGADVIKVESMARLDNIRAFGVQPTEPGSMDTNGVFNDCNANKRSLTLDLGHPRGIELAKELVRCSDIVTNNFTGDRMDRWGLGYDDLRKIKPDIIMLTMPAMGATGPFRRYGSYGNGLIAYSGLNQNMGFADRPPTGMSPLYSDFSAPYATVAALMAAVLHRERTGEGQFIEVAQAEATINLLGTDILECTANGDLSPRMGNRSRDDVPHGVFRCAGEDRWCAVAARDDPEWRRLAELVGRSDLATDARLADVAGRRAHEDEIESAITAWTRTRDAWDVAGLFQGVGLPAGVVEDLADMMTRDPYLPSRHIVPVERNGLVFSTHAQPASIDGRTPSLRAAPHFGEHNEEILTSVLGLSSRDVSALVADGVLS